MNNWVLIFDTAIEFSALDWIVHDTLDIIASFSELQLHLMLIEDFQRSLAPSFLQIVIYVVDDIEFHEIITFNKSVDASRVRDINIGLE